MADAATYQQLVAAQAASRGTLTTMAGTYASQQTASFDNWYSDAAVVAWADQLSSTIQAIQRQTASLTDAYLAQVMAAMTGRPVNPAGAMDITNLRANTTPAKVYSRVAEQFRYAKSTGADDQAAMKAATDRAEVLADTDISLAARAQSQKFMVVNKVDGYRRVIHPELSKTGTCGLCVAASQNFYHQSQLLPLHARCACTTVPIINGMDPGHQLNRDDLDALYKQAGGTQAAQLTKVRFAVHDNSEIGPVLAVHGQHFRSAEDLPQAA